MKELLKERYKELLWMFQITDPEDDRNSKLIIQNVIDLFMKRCKKPAIWCYGYHTKMLMADFMFELKKVKYIIDNNVKHQIKSGFEIIQENQIQEKQIDGIIISTWIYREEIKKCLKKFYPHIKYLDIYDELEKSGIFLERNYYDGEHPYIKYRIINRLQMKLAKEDEWKCRKKLLIGLIKEYILIKDFCTAIKCAEKLLQNAYGDWEKRLLDKLYELYNLQINAMRKLDRNHVLMFCIDGLQWKNVNQKYMKNMYGLLKKSFCIFDHAYAVSTSTYESLIPTYSENVDLRTKYYEKNLIDGKNCRFIQEAKRQKRKIYFYTDGFPYIEDDSIILKRCSQTATEKMWDFLLDAVDEEKGLFYIHILYESHFSYPNPYTRKALITDGMNIMFDYLDRNGGRMRTDYRKQMVDALMYLDDVVPPLLKQLQCSMVLYADHGNIMIDPEDKLFDIEETKYTFHEDLVRVPFAVKSPEIAVGVEHFFISIMELNKTLLGLMNKREVVFEKKEFIKVQRSEIYNPDFRFLYEKAGYKHDLLAFEAFIFANGYELAVYADGKIELYLTETNERLKDPYIEISLLNKVRSEITVCTL